MFLGFRNRLTSGNMLRAETAHITVDGIEYDIVLHVYGERDRRGFLIKPGSQVRIPERGASKEEVLEKLAAALFGKRRSPIQSCPARNQPECWHVCALTQSATTSTSRSAVLSVFSFWSWSGS